MVSKAEPEETKPDAPTPYDEGAPGQTEEVHTEDKPEQKEKPESSNDAHKGEPKDVGAAADKDSPQQASKEA